MFRQVAGWFRRDSRGWLIFAVALAVRMVWVWFAHRDPQGLSDMAIYEGFARSIAQGEGYRGLFGNLTAYYPPGYPYFLGAVVWTAKQASIEHLAVFVGCIQATLGAISAVAVYRSATSVTSQRGALVAGLIMSVWPNLVIYSSVYLSESLFIAALSLSMMFTLRQLDQDSPSVRLMLGAGATFAVALMVRPQVLLIPAALIVVWAALKLAKTTTRLPGILAAMALCSAALITPWTLRNYSVFNEFVPLSTNAGDNLCIGFHEGAYGGFSSPPECDSADFYVNGPEAELRRSRATSAVARDYITSHVDELPALSVKKLRITFAHDHDGLRAVESFGSDPFLSATQRDVLSAMCDLYFFVIAAFALGGIALSITRIGRRARGRLPSDGLCAMLTVMAYLLSGLAVPVIVFGEPRFKMGTVPMLAIFAALAIDALADRFFHPERCSPDAEAMSTQS